ncbi:MAG TPA: DUF2075 domain-containing protein [Candidatus Sulfotelmatobacter sp.]
MPAYYANTVGTFLAEPLGDLELALHKAYELDRYKDLITSQMTAWRGQVQDLKLALALPSLERFQPHTWGIAIEFVIPRRMGRIDTVLLIGSSIVVLEFKGESVDSSAADQVEDYSLDLLHFHAESHGKTIYPVVTGRTGKELRIRRSRAFDDLCPTTFVDTKMLGSWLAVVADRHSRESQMSVTSWNTGAYRPVPTIVEAAIGMFADMQVEDIARSDCDPINLSATVETVRRVAVEAEQKHRKAICFVTGVPGAGKTLAGLDLVHDRKLRDATGSDAVFLTGNLPLVDVLRAALAEDASRRRKLGLRVSSRDPKTTINTVIGYKKEHTRNSHPPHERIVVFDEAQRAWNAKRTAKYLAADAQTWIGYSEPALLLSILDRHLWCVLIALVGGGQEIHTGEAGLSEWGRALLGKFAHWSIALSPQALSGEYGAGAKLFELGTPDPEVLKVYPALHLDNPTRQFRGKTISLWAESLLRGDASECRAILAENTDYSIQLTRKLVDAKTWLRDAARGTERYGLIASSGAKRLRAEGLELPPAGSRGVEHWFLKGKEDVRSSFQLEVAATEFQIQGLEIDWAGVCWGGDFLRSDKNWNAKQFKGTAWCEIHDDDTRNYVPNTYRVLLTRARQGMVLFIPEGSSEDVTRPPASFNETADFLVDCGATTL